MLDPELGRRSSRELAAVRTALGSISRALEELATVRQYGFDEDRAFNQIASDLLRAQAVLAKYKRTGRPRKTQEE